MLSPEQRQHLLACPKDPVDIVMDTDAYNEIDDQFAISYALRARNRLYVRAFYAAPFLNGRSESPLDGMEKSYSEIHKLLHLAKEERPVFKGSDRYLKSEKEAVDSPAARDLIKRAPAYSADKPLYVVGIGAITNVASALLMAPEIADRIVVIWLGGHSLNWHDTHEFNMSQDVAAARVLYASGSPLVILPCMGVVSALTTTEPELRHWLSGKNALSDYLVTQTIDEANTYAAGRVWSRVIWDAATIAWLLNERGDLLLDRLIPTPIPEYDYHYGFDPRRPFCKYVYHINRDAVFADLFEKLSAE